MIALTKLRKRVIGYMDAISALADKDVLQHVFKFHI